LPTFLDRSRFDDDFRLYDVASDRYQLRDLAIVNVKANAVGLLTRYRPPTEMSSSIHKVSVPTLLVRAESATGVVEYRAFKDTMGSDLLD
jgi:hypothetical protein